MLTGISGNELVGTFVNNSGNHSFCYNGSTYTQLDDPLELDGMYTFATHDRRVVLRRFKHRHFCGGRIYCNTRPRALLLGTRPGANNVPAVFAPGKPPARGCNQIDLPPRIAMVQFLPGTWRRGWFG